MSHLHPLNSTRNTENTPKCLTESEQTDIAFVSSIGAILTINTIGLLLTATRCEGGGKRCYEMDVSCTDFTLASIWAIAGGFIGQVAKLPRGSRYHFMSNEQFATFKRHLVCTASSCSALALQTLSKFAMSLIRCSEKQRQEGVFGVCRDYDAEVGLPLVFIIGMLSLLILNSPSTRR